MRKRIWQKGIQPLPDTNSACTMVLGVPGLTTIRRKPFNSRKSKISSVYRKCIGGKLL